MKEKEERKYYFYKTTNTINGHYYYGVHTTCNLDDGYLGSGKRLWYAIRKYGKENFVKDIQKFFNNMNEAYEYEAEIVTPDVVADPNCYNLRPGGHGGKGYKFTKQQRNVQSINAINQWKSEELRKQNSESNKKTWSDPELRKKHREICKKSITEEARRKKSEAMKRRWQDPEYVQWQREINSGVNNPMYGKTPHNKRL